jgi:hypothetical protein
MAGGSWRVALCGVLASVFRDCLDLVLLSFVVATDVWLCLKEEWFLFLCFWVSSPRF